MFKAARLATIKEILIDRNQVDVHTLSSLLDVSSVTIRNDLETLEKQGYLRRTHGGAILNDTKTRNQALASIPPVETPEFDKARDNIAKIAAQMACEDEWIFLGPGATCGYIAKHLAEAGHHNIITNNLYAALSFPTGSNANVIVTGGTLNFKGNFLAGEMLDAALENIHVSKAFFSVQGIDIRGGFSVATYPEKRLFDQLMQISNQIIIVADYRKFDKISFIRIGALDSVKSLITNENIPDNYKTFLFDKGVQLFTTYDINPSSVQGS